MKCGSNYQNGSSLTRFNRKSANKNERLMFQNWWNELNQMYGTYVDYFVYDYALSAQDFFYGEQPLAPYKSPVPMVMMAQFNGDSLLLSKFGIRTDADVTFIIPILTFRAAFNNNAAEPKAGDLIRLTELGWDRPGSVDDLNELNADTSTCSGYSCAINTYDMICNDGLMGDTENSQINCSTDSSYFSTYNEVSAFNKLIRGAHVFEITERRDENLTMNYNMLQGHYVWIIHAKRFDYSYQPNAPREPGSDQVSDETLYGKLSGGTNYPENPKPYPDNVDDESKKRIWDYDKSPNSDNSVYGNY